MTTCCTSGRCCSISCSCGTAPIDFTVKENFGCPERVIRFISPYWVGRPIGLWPLKQLGQRTDSALITAVFAVVLPIVGLTVAFAVLAACARTSVSDGHEALLVVGFLTIGAAPTVGCAAVGALIAQLAARPGRLDAGVEAGTRAATAALAGSLFVLSGASAYDDPVAGAIACVTVVIGSVLEAYLHTQIERKPTAVGTTWGAIAPAALVAAGTAPIGM